MTISRFVNRSNKLLLASSICFFLVLCAVVFIGHGTQIHLQEVLKSRDICYQQLEALQTKFQSTVQDKLKAEKLLSVEKEDIKNELEKAQIDAKHDREQWIAEKEEKQNQYNLLNDKVVGLQAEIDDLQKENLELKETKSKLEAEFLAVKNSNVEQVQNKDREINELQSKLQNCQKGTDNGDKEVANKSQYAKSEEDKLQVDHAQAASSFNTSTPGINPQAVLDDDGLKMNSKTSTTTTVRSVNKDGNANVLAAPAEEGADSIKDVLNSDADQQIPESQGEAGQESNFRSPDKEHYERKESARQEAEKDGSVFAMPPPLGDSNKPSIETDIKKQVDIENNDVKIDPKKDDRMVAADEYNDDGDAANDFPMVEEGKVKMVNGEPDIMEQVAAAVRGQLQEESNKEEGNRESVMVQPK